MVLSSAVRRAASRVVPLAISGSQSYLRRSRSSALVATVDQPSRNLLRTPFPAFIHRYFTKPKLDESLIRVLESKVRCTVESQDAEEDEEVPQDFPLEIEDNPGQQTVTLTRDYQGETIIFEVSMPDLVTGKENNKNDDDEEGKGSGNPSSIPLAVRVSKENGPSLELEFACTASPDEVATNRLSIRDPENSEDQIAYKGPGFADLGENLQKAFHEYLEIRGIKPSMTNFLHGYMINKDAREYITWLKNLKRFVEATFNTTFFYPAGGGGPILYQHRFRVFNFKSPFSDSNLNTHCTICFNSLHNGTPTMFRSGFLPQISKNWASKTQSAGNQRHISSLVGTSETTRKRTYPKSFCEWLAGIIDGDGSIQVNKKGCTSLEITTGLEDLRLLRYIQHMLGGGIKMRAGAKSYRYRLHNHLGMIKVLDCINGHIRHSARLLQLHRVCQVLEIPVIQPTPPDAQSNWFAGFFDADGNITIAMKHGLPELSIRVTNKLLQDVESYKVVFGGSLYFDSSRNGYYQWSIESRKDVILMLDYFKSNTFRSHKSRRFFLIEEYYSLYDLEAFKPESIHHKAWLAFLDKWK